MNYYYLVASLPPLKMEEPAPLSMDAFRALCREHLREDHMAAMDAVLDECEELPVLHPFVQEWRNTRRQVLNAVARQRATRLQRDPAPFLRRHDGFDVWIELGVSDAFQRPNPLERQRTIDRLLWERAGEAAAGNPFGESALFAYAIRLGLALRWSAMVEEAGARTLDERVVSGASIS
jgi:hypothetical protein